MVFTIRTKIISSMVSVNRRTALRLIGLIGTTSLAGCAGINLSGGPNERPPESIGTSWSPPDSEWRFPQADLLNTARSRRELRSQPPVTWQNRQDAVDIGEAVSADVVSATTEMVVTAVARDDGVILYAYDASDGKQRWRQQIDFSHGRRYPQFGGLVNDTLYLTDTRTDVIAVDTSAGTVRWQMDLHEQFAETVSDRFLTGSGHSSDWFSLLPLATPEAVYIQSSYGIHGLAPEDGREQWRIYLGNTDSRVLEDLGGLALGDNRVWASYGGPIPSVYTIEMFDGSPMIERATAPLDLPGRPVVTNDGDINVARQVAWSTDARETLAFGVAGGTGVTWQFPGLASSGAAAFSSLATDGTRIFICEGHERMGLFVVFALRASTGGVEWIFRDSLYSRDISTASPAEFRLSQPVVAEDTVITGYGISSGQETSQGTLIGLSTSDGRERWRTDVSIAPKDIVVTDDRVFVGGQQKGVLAFEPKDS